MFHILVHLYPRRSSKTCKPQPKKALVFLLCPSVGVCVSTLGTHFWHTSNQADCQYTGLVGKNNLLHAPL